MDAEQTPNPNLPAVIPRQPDYSSEKSEEVQSIIERMPTHWTKWTALCVGVLMGIILLLGFLVQYPDTVDGQVSVTAATAPVRLVANTSGRLILLRENKTSIGKGDEISYIESVTCNTARWVGNWNTSVSGATTVSCLRDRSFLP